MKPVMEQWGSWGVPLFLESIGSRGAEVRSHAVPRGGHAVPKGGHTKPVMEQQGLAQVYLNRVTYAYTEGLSETYLSHWFIK